MKALKYYAEETVDARAKTGYLFENGIFICEFEHDRKPRYICRKYDFQIPPDKTTWDKNVIDLFSTNPDAESISVNQTFIKQETIYMDFEQVKNSLISRKVRFWKEYHHSSKRIGLHLHDANLNSKNIAFNITST